ncbi:MAG: extracellular solute-binding protein [Ignavibacteriales bacterium]|nr:extracellular solute-binding protein [Ignavibacteriales bacterium]
MLKIKTNIKRFYISIAAITFLVITVLVVMFLYSDYFKVSNGEVKKIYFVDNISQSHKLIIAHFNELNKGKIEVIPIDLPFEKFSTNERKELLIRYLRSGSDRLDLFSVDQIWVPRFAKWTEPLSKYFPESQRKLIVDQAMKTCYYENELVAMPLYFDIGILYYNSLLLKKLPDYNAVRNELDNFITWDRFITIGQKLKSYGHPIYVYPADDYEGLMCSFVEMLESQNEKLFVNDTVSLNTKAAENALQLLVDLEKTYKLSPKEITDFRETESYFHFVNNQDVFLRGWPGFYEWYRKNVKNQDVSNIYEKAPMPHFKEGRPASIIGGWNLMMSKYSTKKNEVIEFVKFLLSNEEQKIFYEVGGYLPIRKTMYSDTVFLETHSELKFYNKILKSGVHRPFSEKYTKCSDIIASYLNLAIQNKIGVKEALGKAQRIINSGDVFIK